MGEPVETGKGNCLMKVFLHHIYEFKKGLRNLVLFTERVKERPFIEANLKKCGIEYAIFPLGKSRINVYFGHSACVDIVRRIGFDNLSSMSPEHDFMLGIMLGYNRIMQCERYLARSADAAGETCIPLTEMFRAM
jgi:hypothetical protein